MIKSKIANFLIATSLLTSCAVGKDYEKPKIEINNEFAASEQSLEKLDFEAKISDESLEKWWESFHDPVLNNLISEAIENNKDIAIAIERVNEVRSDKAAAIAGYYPSLSANSTLEREGLSSKTSNNTTGQKERDSFSTGLTASWEIDIFGKTQRAVEAAQANIEVEDEVKHGVLLTVTAELATSYFEARGLQKEIEFTQRNILLLKEIEELANSQFELGVVTELDLNRARGERQEFESNLPALESDLMSTIYRISVLTGNTPEAQIERLEEYKKVNLENDIIPVGLRGDILRRRPDIRQAERRLAAQTAYVGVAEGELYPSFSIGGDIGSSAARISDLFTAGSGFYTLGTIIDWNIFEGGALRANISGAESRLKQAQLEYEKAILLALEDVESALIKYGKEWQVLEKLREAQIAREESFKIAKYRYEEGVENFQTVLDAERTLITTEEKVIESETRILTYLAQVYKSLGGGWQVIE